MMSNDDSFSNIAPALENKPAASTLSKKKNIIDEANIDDLNLDQDLEKVTKKEKKPNNSAAGMDIDAII